MKKIEEKNTRNNNWRTITTAIIFALAGFLTFYLAFTLQATGIYGQSDYGAEAVFIAAGLLLAISIGLYQQRNWAFLAAYVIASLSIIGALYFANALGVLIWLCALYLTYASKTNSRGLQENPNAKYWFLGAGIIILAILFFAERPIGESNSEIATFPEYRANYDKVEIDMSKPQVLQIMGPPASKSENILVDGTIEYWSWTTGYHAYIIGFYNGRVFVKQTS